MNTNRRDFLKKSALVALVGVAGSSFAKSIVSSGTPDKSSPQNSPFVLPPLPYTYNALEPHIDQRTMEIHHDKHHQGYVDKLNKALSADTTGATYVLEDILTSISKQSDAVRNNAGGHYNHSLFWTLMKPNGGGVPTGKLGEAINQSFGTFDAFKKKFSDAASTRFGSGWAWLVVDTSVPEKNILKIGSTANQDNPLMDISEFKGTPLLALDVWEHAYYLHYQNKRADYVNNWWNVVNWEKANELFVSASK